MIDIVNFNGEKFNLGYSKVLNSRQFNIAYGNKNNRKLVENKNLDILVSPERMADGENLNVLNSGLNHIICRIARNNDIAIGISISEILKNKDRPRLLAKIMQNITLCRKYKVKMMVGSFANNKYEMRSARDVHNFCLVLGMNQKEAKWAMNFQKKESIPRLL